MIDLEITLVPPLGVHTDSGAMLVCGSAALGR